MESHETSLLSHLKLIQSLAKNTAETDRVVDQVLDSAQKLVENFSLLREQLVSFLSLGNLGYVLTDGFSKNKQKFEAKVDARETHNNNLNGKRKIHAMPKSQRASASKMEDNSASESHQNFHTGQKRSRMDIDADTKSSGVEKRTRTKRAIPGANDDVSDYVPVALQKDDISDQVEQRLRLREEQRRVKRSLSADEPGKKRKRDSGGTREVATKPDRAIRKRHRAD